MFRVKDGLGFTANIDGSVIIFKNGDIIATLTKDDWVSVITHVAHGNRPPDEIHDIAEKLHTGQRLIHPFL